MKKRGRLRKGLAILLSLAMVVGMMPDLGIMKVSAEVAYNENGFAEDGSYEPATPTTDKYDIDGDGVYDNVYEISNAGQLYWFAGLVNGTLTDVIQDTSAKAVLTQDITVNTGVLDENGELAGDTKSFTSWTPIGNYINNTHVQYTGTFDGKGHTISGLYFDGSISYLGFFGCVGSGGSVSNVGILDSYFSGDTFVGGVCGDNFGTITNCYHTGAVSGTNAGGVCGYNSSSGSITNCYHTGAVSGYYAGGVCGDNNSSGSIKNCYYEKMDGITGGINGKEVTGQAQGKTKGQFNDGVVAYLLSSGADGSIWGQTLTEEGGQVYPVLRGEAVYCICINGIASYANHDGESKHLYDNGICSGCGIYEVPVYENECYQIANKGNLYWFAGLVNGDAKVCTGVIKQDTSAKAVLTKDITVNTGVLDGTGKLAEDTSSFTSWTPIGNLINNTHVQYTGTFDGKGHTISGLYFDGSISCLGFFGCVGSGGSVSNVGIVDSYFSGGDYAGGVCGENYGTITNCYHTGSVRGLRAGGVCGDNESYGSITNCYHTGSVSGTDAGGVCGYNYGSGSITNCYHTGSVSGTNAGGVCGYNYGSGSITNCYYETMDGIAGGIQGSDETGKAQGKTKGQFNDGVVAYLLSCGTDGSIWGQTLTGEGRQAYPVLGGAAVYKICKNGGVSYANNEGDSEHSYNNGICSVCGVYEVPVYENDCYQIANKGNLYWFAGLVNGDAKICTGDVTQNKSAKAVLTQDITVNTGVLDENGELAGDTKSFTSWTPIGNRINNTDVKYTGTFDGKGHTISGLYFDGSTSRLGFFGYVGKGGSVSNVGILDSYFSGGEYVGGVCGDNSGSITNCYHTGAVRGKHAGGVCGYNSSDGSITNCYHTGAVRGTNAGGVCGYKSSSGSITNCYYETMDGIKGGIQGSDVTGKAQGKDTNQFRGGEVAYLLSSGKDGSIWGQTLTEEGRQAYPVLGGKAVYRICKNGSVSYANNEGESEHSYNNGICSGCGVYEVPVYENECYQIANKGNLYWFAGLVNGDAKICTGDIKQDRSAKAVLTQDITVNTGVLDGTGKLAGDTSSFTSWTPIGNDSNQYTGTFDGKGYKIEGLYFKDTSTDYVGLFGYIGEGGYICNVGIEDSYFHGQYKVGGVCGRSDKSTITNCYHTGVVNGNDSVGGVCGYNHFSYFTNCYHTGLVSGNTTSVGGVCGKSDNNNNFTNCYYETMDGIKGGIKGADVTGKAEGKTTKQFNDGEVAYLLSQGCTYNGTYYDGSAWGQTLTGDGQQAYPVFGVSKVYLKGTYTGCECNPGEPTSANGYSNEKNDTVYGAHSMTAHSANNATCTKDGNLAYWTCSNGEGLYYKDEAGTEKYNSYDDDIKLPATGHADEGLDGECDVCGEAFKTFKQLGKLIDKVNQNLSDGKYADVQYTTASIDNLRRALVAAGAITAQSLDTEVVTAFDNLLTASTVDAGGLIKADKNIVIKFGEADETRGVVAGSGWYAKGDTVTLKVMPRIGYRLSKWTTDAPGNTSVGTKNLFTFVLAAESPDTYYVWLDEVKYTVTCESAEGGTCTTDAEDGKYVYGQIATVTATADENYAFVGWKDSYKTTVSTDHVYSFTVLGDTTLAPEFVKTTTEQGEAISYVTVSFYHQSGKLLDSQKVVSGEGKITTTVNAPTKVGFDFLGWSTKKNATKLEEVVDLSATTFSKDTCLYPVFAVQDIKYTLKVDGQLKEVAPQSGVMVVAEAIEGKQFVGWKNEAGNIVSYDSTYTFIITGNTTLTSYYEPINAVIEKTPTINMSAPVYEDIDDNGDKYYKMIFYFDYTLPEDCTLIDIGTIKVKNTDLSSEGITLDTENVSQYSVLSKLGVDGQFYYSKANYYGTGHTVAGYMIYEKNGIRYTVYSNAMYGIKTSN